MARKGKFLCGLLLVGLVLTGATFAAEVQPKPIEWMAELETEVTGNTGNGGLMQRLNALEELITGRISNDSLINRLSYLNRLIYINRPHDISLIYKVQALEWVLYKRSYPETLKERIERVENSLFHRVFEGPFDQRLEKLISQVFPDGIVKGNWITIPEGLVVKVKLLDSLSSEKNSVGDKFRYQVLETVTKDGLVIFPAGTMGEGMLRDIERPGKLGNDAKLGMDFRELRGLDGTPVSLIYRNGIGEDNPSRKYLVGASVAGMALLGPEGILLGLAVKGKEQELLEEAEFYLQVKETVRIVTLFK